MRPMTGAAQEAGDVVGDGVGLVKSDDAAYEYRPHAPLIQCSGTRIGWVQFPDRIGPPARGLTPPKRLSTPATGRAGITDVRCPPSAV